MKEYAEQNRWPWNIRNNAKVCSTILNRIAQTVQSVSCILAWESRNKDRSYFDWFSEMTLDLIGKCSREIIFFVHNGDGVEIDTQC